MSTVSPRPGGLPKPTSSSESFRRATTTSWAQSSSGANLSLGQWQRIALARAFFRDAPFVILDEPTASLDPRAEAALFENVRTLYKGRAVLLISHRAYGRPTGST